MTSVPRNFWRWKPRILLLERPVNRRAVATVNWFLIDRGLVPWIRTHGQKDTDRGYRLVEGYDAGEYPRAKALPEESPFGRSPRLVGAPARVRIRRFQLRGNARSATQNQAKQIP